MRAHFPVTAEKENALYQRMEKWGVRESDLEEKFVRSQGHGGQNINKVSTCVVLIHKPTRVQVKCQKERSQALNRFLARRILTDKIEAIQTGQIQKEKAEQHRIRKQKKRRSRRLKEKIRHTKESQSEKKSLRQSISYSPD